jgi:voltage-gated potassium channel
MPPSDRRRWRRTLHEVIFEAETPAGRAFDLALIALILVSVLAVLLESVEPIRSVYGRALYWFEWTITVVFTIEYLLRLLAVDRPVTYARSFFGVVDLLAILPTYLSLAFPGAQSLLVIRALRLLRVFRVFKLGHFVGEAQTLRRALRASSRKIAVFLVTVLTLVLIVGAAMYLIEGPAKAASPASRCRSTGRS